MKKIKKKLNLNKTGLQKKTQYLKGKILFNFIFIITFFLILLLLFKIFLPYFGNFNIITEKIYSKEKYIKNLYLLEPFSSYDTRFKPAITLYSKKKNINIPVSGKIIYYSDNRINPYTRKNYRTLSVISDNKYYYYISDLDLSLDLKSISNDNNIRLINNTFDFYVKKNQYFINPLTLIKPNFARKNYIVNFYHLNKNNIVVSFRFSYKNNYLKFAVYAYSKIYTPYFIKTTNISSFNLYLDNKLIYSQNLLRMDKKIYSFLKTVFLKKYMIALQPIYVKNGEHKLKIEVFDMSGNKKQFSKKFYVKSD